MFSCISVYAFVVICLAGSAWAGNVSQANGYWALDNPNIRVLTNPIDSMPFLDPFVLDSREAVLAVPDYSNGHISPTCTRPFPVLDLSASTRDMPWVGVCDLQPGMGYIMIFETSDDALVQGG